MHTVVLPLRSTSIGCWSAQARIRLDFVRIEELCPSELEPFWHTVAYGCPASDSWAEARRRPQDARGVLRGIFAAAFAMWVSQRPRRTAHDN